MEKAKTITKARAERTWEACGELGHHKVREEEDLSDCSMGYGMDCI